MQPERVMDFIQGQVRTGRPIEQKYGDGRVKRTLKKGFKALEIVKGEAGTTDDCLDSILERSSTSRS